VGGAGSDAGSECSWDMAAAEDSGWTLFDWVRGALDGVGIPRHFVTPL